jgi:hypothetical protein
LDPEKVKVAVPVVAGVKGEAAKGKGKGKGKGKAKVKAKAKAVGVRGAWPPGWAENVSARSAVIASPTAVGSPARK